MSTATIATPIYQVPPGALVMELKYCELCGIPFQRKIAPTEPYESHSVRYWNLLGYTETTAVLRKDHGIRYCKKCIGRALMPNLEEQEEYKAQLPGTENQMRHSTHLPRYDDSLSPRVLGRQTQSHYTKTRAAQLNVGNPYIEMLRKAKQWRDGVREAFKTRGRLSTEDLQALIPNAWTLADVHAKLRYAFPDVKTVGFLPSRDKLGRGRGPAIYELPGASPAVQ